MSSFGSHHVLQLSYRRGALRIKENFMEVKEKSCSDAGFYTCLRIISECNFHLLKFY